MIEEITINGRIYIKETHSDGFVAQYIKYRGVNTVISNEDLWDRFNDTEQEDLIDAANKKIKKFVYEMRMRPTFDLTDSRLDTAINALETAGIIGVGRAAEILAI